MQINRLSPTNNKVLYIEKGTKSLKKIPPVVTEIIENDNRKLNDTKLSSELKTARFAYTFSCA